MAINNQLLAFFEENHAPGRMCLIGASDPIGMLVREAQSKVTPNKKPSLWSHSFLLGEKRSMNGLSGLSDIYIFESDLDINTQSMQIRNGAQESNITKWCATTHKVEHACVLGFDLAENDWKKMLQQAHAYAYDGKHHLNYPLLELVGTAIAIATGRLGSHNIFDNKYAVQCCTFVRMCFDVINKKIIDPKIDPTNTLDELIYQYIGNGNFKKYAEWHA